MPTTLIEGATVVVRGGKVVAAGTGVAIPAGVPVLVGATRDEWKLFSVADPKAASLDDAGLRKRIARIPDADALLAAYRDARDKRGAATTPIELFNAIETIPCVASKAKWALKWINSEDRCARA